MKQILFTILFITSISIQSIAQQNSFFAKGEVIKCMPIVEHWHGATATTGVTYMASSPTQKSKTI
jgi:hypothetical protein